MLTIVRCNHSNQPICTRCGITNALERLGAALDRQTGTPVSSQDDPTCGTQFASAATLQLTFEAITEQGA